MAEVNWAELTPRLRAGDWTCGQHGLIEPLATPVVPVCPQCRKAAFRVAVDRRGVIRFEGSAPTHCAGAERHPLGPNRVLVGWLPCGCLPARAGNGGHRTWSCRACSDVQRWPPCEGDRATLSFRL